MFFQTLNPNLLNLRNVVDKAVSNRDVYVEKFRQLLDKDIDELVKDVKAIKRDCQVNTYCNKIIQTNCIQ